MRENHAQPGLPEPSRASPGFKHIFVSNPLGDAAIAVAGMGFYESMRPGMIERKKGTGDHLLMIFHDPVQADSRPIEKGSLPLLPPGTMMIWTPGMGQYYGNRLAAFRHTWIHCNGASIKRVLAQTRLPLGRPFQTNGAASFASCVLSLRHELTFYSQPDPIIVANLLENALREIARSLQPLATRGPENLLHVWKWLATAPAQPVCLKDLAQRAGMSVSHFSEQFKKYFGLSPMDCLIRHRMSYASWLLADKTLRIADVAQRVGYSDPFHFSKAYKKSFGQSPRQARCLTES